MNSARMIRSGTSRNATTHGIASSSVNSIARSCAARAPCVVAGREPPRHLGQQHGADRDADHAAGKLIEPVGVIERRERAGREEARDDGVGEQRKLHAGRADGRRPERLEEALHVVVELRAPQRRSSRRRAAPRRRPAALRARRRSARPRPPHGRRSERTPRAAASTIMVRLSRIGAAAAVAKLADRIEDAGVTASPASSAADTET